MSILVDKATWGLLLSLLLTANRAYAAPQLSLQQIFKENAPAVVLIRIVDATGKTLSIGSGFTVSPSGVIVTNRHVIEPKPGVRLVVKLPNGDEYDDVWVVHDDERRDFAVLLIKASGLSTVKLSDSDKVEVGEQVVAIGNPKGLELTFTSGIVSAVRPDPRKGYRFIQHQAPISPGSSGGPLLNMRGEVIGINTFFFEGGQNLNGAVPVNYVKPYLQSPPRMTYEQYARAGTVPPGGTLEKPPIPPGAWRKYLNDRYGFSFEYPGDWKLDDLGDREGPDLRLSLHVSGAFLVRLNLSVFTGNSAFFYDKEGRHTFGKEIDLQKTLEKAYQRREIIGRTISDELFRGEGYTGYYRVFEEKPVPDVINVSIRGEIFSKSRIQYQVFGACQVVGGESVNCERTFLQFMKSFKVMK